MGQRSGLVPDVDSKISEEATLGAECPKSLRAPNTDEGLKNATLAILQGYNIIAAAIGKPASTPAWQSADRKHIIPALYLSADQNFDRGLLGEERTREKFAVLAETVTSSAGFSPAGPD